MAWSKDNGSQSAVNAAQYVDGKKPLIEQAIVDANVAKPLAETAKTESGQAKVTAGQADTKATDALAKATLAKTTAETVQGEFDRVVAEAGSNNPEVVQARGSEVTLKARLDKTTAQLADIATLELVADIPNTSYLTGRKVDVNFIRSRQAILYAKFFQKLRTGLAVQIDCKGDSLTEGYDIVSADKVTGGNGGTPTVASSVYPAKLQEYLNQIYNNKVTVINRGYSGDWVKNAYNKWKTKSAADITITMFGTNDVSGSWVPEDYKGKLEEYLNWYEQFIIRETLWDKAVIILTSPKLKVTTGNDLDTYRNALYLLGDKYGVPVIDSEEFMKNYTPSIYSDSTHFNSVGYSIFAAKVASLFIGEGLKNINHVGNGTKLLSRPTLDNIAYFGGASMSIASPTETPNETDVSQGIVANLPANGGVIYSFYAEKDDLVAIPYAFLNTGTSMKVELDFGVIQPQNSIDGAILQNAGSETTASVITYPKEASNYTKAFIFTNNKETLRIAIDGWHTIKITAIGGAVILNGIEFVSTQDVANYTHQKDLITDSDGAHGLKIESGNWTPKWGADIDGAHTYSVQEGTYTKINKLVFARGVMTITAKDSSMSGMFLALKGLPFVPAKLSPVTIASAQNITLPAGKTRIVASAGTSGNIALKAGDINGADVSLSSAAITNTTSFEFSVTYLTV